MPSTTVSEGRGGWFEDVGHEYRHVIATFVICQNNFNY